MRETKIQRMKVAEMRPADYNPRRISADAMAGLRASVQRFGLVQPIIVNERTGNVVGGHQRLKVLTAEGVDEVDVVVVDLPSSEERALNVALNNPHISGEFTEDLGGLLELIARDTPDLFEALRLDDLGDLLAEEDVGEADWPGMEDDVQFCSRTIRLLRDEGEDFDRIVERATPDGGSVGDGVMVALRGWAHE